MMSWRTPPASMMIGCATPRSVSLGNARQSSSPLCLSNATTRASGDPPTRQMSWSPSTSGALAKPQSKPHRIRSTP